MKIVQEEGVGVPSGPEGLAVPFVHQLVASEVHHDVQRAVEYAYVPVAKAI